MSGFAIKIGADTRPLEQGLKAALGVATQTAAQIGTRYAAAATGIDKVFAQTARNVGLTFGREVAAAVTPATLGIGAGIAGFVALKFAVDAVGDAAKAAQERLASLVKIGAEARNLGIGTTFLQSLTGQAKALGTEVSALTAMLDKAREASTVSIGEGDGKASSTILNRLQQNVKAGNLGTVDLDRFTNAESQEARIKVILDLLDQLRAKGANLAAFDLARTMFGSEFETKLRTGVDMIGAMRRALDGIAAGDQGRIIPPEEIQRAENLNRRLEEAQRILEAGLAPIQRDIAFWQQQQLAGWVDIKEQIAGAAAVAGRLYEWVSGIGKVLSNLGSSNVFATLRDYAEKAGLIDKGEQARIERMLNGGLEAKDKPAVPADAGAGGPLQIAVKPKADTSRSLPSLTAPKAKAAPSSTEISAIETFVGSLEKSAAALKAEADAYGKSSAERRIAIELAKAQEIATQNGTTLTEEQTRRIRESATAIAEQRDKIEDLRDSQENLRAGGREVFGGLYQDARNGVSALDMLNNALGRIIDRIANSQIDGFVDALFGKNGSNGSLSGLFGGGLASLFGGGAGGALTTEAAFNAGATSSITSWLADGGLVGGNGGPTADDQLVAASTGEFMVKASATKKHLPLLRAINEDRLVQRAQGGMIGTAIGAMTMPAADAARAAMGQASSAASTAPPMKSELHIHGGAAKTEAQTSNGPMGPRTDVWLDRNVAAMLLSGPSTREALKKLTGSKMVGG